MNEIIDRDLLIALPQPKDALSVFASEDGSAIEPFLKMVRDKIDAFNGDATTAVGRAAIKSMAYKVSQSKAALEEVGKALADEQKAIPKRIDATRKRIKDTLDLWRDEVRAPVDEWEAIEKKRIDRIKKSFDEWNAVIADQVLRPALVVRERLAELEAEEITDAKFGEFLSEALPVHSAAIEAVKARILVSEKHEAEQAELAKLRAEKEERDRLDREADIRAQAAAEERQRNERAAQADRDAAAKREADLQRERDDAERRATEAAQQAIRDQEAKAAKEAADAAARERDTKHRASVNRGAVDALVAAGIDKDVAKQVVTLIAKRAVPAVCISY